MQLWNLGASFTKTTSTAYVTGALVSSNSSTAAWAPLQFQIGGNSQPGQTRVTRVRLQKSSTTTAGASFRLHLYGVSPNTTSTDGAPWLTDNSANYLGGFDVTSMYAFSDGAGNIGVPTTGNGNDVLLRLNNGKTIFGALVMLSSYNATASESFSVTLETQDAY
jgi:hypothetical protein